MALFLYTKWLGLPLHLRNEIAKAMGIDKSMSTHVVDNVVQNDGYRIQDVESKLSVDALQAYLGVDSTDLSELMDMLVLKVQGKDIAQPAKEADGTLLEVEQPIIPEEVVVEVPMPKTRTVKPVKKVVKKKK